MTPEAIAEVIAETLDGLHLAKSNFWTVAHVDQDPASVWIEANSEATDGSGGGIEFRLTVEHLTP